MRQLFTLIVLLFFCSLSTAIAQPNFSEETLAHFHEFDFWIGEWDVYKYGTDSLVGHSQIKAVNSGLAIQENYQSTQGPFEGTSLNKYHVQDNQWEQFWVDNGGATLRLTGGFKNGRMVLSERTKGKDGILINQISWRAVPENKVRQTWEVSRDEGVSWVTLFDGEYIPVQTP